MMKNIHFALQRLCAIIIGLVFFASGILKIIDPVGVSLIVKEYLKFMHIGWMMPAAYAIAVALPLVETIAGAALLGGLCRRSMAIVSALMNLFFLGISIVLVIVNPEMDCGCFGEAVHLTHAQTLWKNIILVVLWCIAFLPFPWKEKNRKGKIAAFILVVFLTLFLSIRSIISLPMVDFTAYSAGDEIYTTSQVEGENNPILGLRDITGEYCDSVAYEGRIMAMSIYEPERLSIEDWKVVCSWTLDCTLQDFIPLVIVSSTDEQMESILQSLGQEDSFMLESALYFSDYKTLITLNRSNAGVTYISDSVIIEKWASDRRPDQQKLHSLAGFDPVEEMLRTNTHGRVAFESIALLSVAALLLL